MLSSAKYPVLLMPVKLETRYVVVKSIEGETNQLWVRIFPDKIFLNSFDPNLSKEETSDLDKYQPIFSNATATEIDKQNAWKALVDKYGVPRASWLLQAKNEHKNTANQERLFNFNFQWLPDYFRIYLYVNGVIVKEVDLANINRAGLKIFEEQEEDWLLKMDRAVEVGMAEKIPIDALTPFDKVIAIGLRKEETTPSSDGIRSLLNNHLYTDGLNFLDYGTATNNIETVKSGYSSKDKFDAKGSFHYATEGYEKEALNSKLVFPKIAVPETNEKINELLLEEGFKEHIEQTPNYAERLVGSLGFKLDDFKYVKHANKNTTRLHTLIQKATWFATGGQMLEELFGENLSNEAHEEIWNFYSKYVKNRGAYPFIQIDKLPYGILPVTHFRDIQSEINISQSGTFQQKMDLILAKLMEQWLAMTPVKYDKKVKIEDPNDATKEIETTINTHYVPRLTVGGNDNDWELGEILSMEPTSSTLHVRILELERMKNILTDRFENKNLFTVPQSMFSYPPKLVEELIQQDTAYKRDLTHADTAYNIIKDNFGDFLPKNQIPKYSSLLTFKFAGSVEAVDAPTAAIKDSEGIAEVPGAPTETVKELILPITLDTDWYKTDFLKLVHDRFTKNSRFYSGRTDFLLIDLLNESFLNFRKRYDRDILFYPDLVDVKDIASYKVSLTKDELIALRGKKVEKGAKVFELIATNKDGNTTHNIPIYASFEGIIEEIYFLSKIDDPVDGPSEIVVDLADDRKLFRLKAETKLNVAERQMAALQAQIILEIERLQAIGADYMQAQKEAVLEMLDLTSFRLDTWLTGLAFQRIQQLRTEKAEGLYFGAYGWVEQLEPRNPAELDLTTRNNRVTLEDTNDVDGGIIHAPTSEQVVTAAMFRQSFETYKDDPTKVNPYTLHLSSDRIQKSQQLSDGIRKEQELEALLGYKLERFLRENGKVSNIANLRKTYPLTVNKIPKVGNNKPGLSNMTVINALAFMKNYSGRDEILKKAQHFVENILDGYADLLVYEAGFHMLQGNFSQAAATMDASKGLNDPPKTTALDTRIPGISQTHKLLLFFDPPIVSLDDEPGTNPKAFLEPVLEQWIQQIIGELSTIATKVLIFKKEDNNRTELGQAEVTLDELGIGYQDFLYLSKTPLNNDASELEERILSVAKTKPALRNLVWESNTEFELTEEVAADKNSLHRTIELLSFVFPLFKVGRAAKAADIAADSDLNVLDSDTPTITPDDSHLLPWKKKLEKCISQIKTANISLEILSKYDIQNAKNISNLEAPATIERARKEAIKKALTCTKLFEDWKHLEQSIQIDRLEKVTEILFGKDFKLIHPFKPTATFKKAIQEDQRMLIGEETITFPNGTTGGQERIRHWLDGRAAVSPESEALADFLLVAENWNAGKFKEVCNPNFADWHFSIAQYLSKGTFPWLALSEAEVEKIRTQPIYNGQLLPNIEEGQIYPDGGASIISYMSSKFEYGQQAYYGLFIDGFSETIPNKKQQTGVAFQYDAPNNEPPQTLLLVAPSDTVKRKGRWEIENLRDVVNDTIDLAKVRMVDIDALQKYEYALPTTYWFNIPNTI